MSAVSGVGATSLRRLLTSAVPAIVLVLLALIGVLFEAPAAVRAPLSLLAIAATAARLARHRRQGGLDALLVAVGGALIVLVLIGLLLGVSGVGLRAETWAIALAALSVGALVASAFAAPPDAEAVSATTSATTTSASATSASATTGTTTPASATTATTTPASPTAPVKTPGARRWLQLAPWVLGSVAVTALALVVSVRGVAEQEGGGLEMSLASLAGAGAVVVVASDEATGQLELHTDTGDGSAITYPQFSVQADSTVATPIVIPPAGRIVITLNNPGQIQPLRTLVIDR